MDLVSLDLRLAVPIVAIVALGLFALLLIAKLDRTRRRRLIVRERLQCPIHRRQAVVDLLVEEPVDEDGGDVYRDVLRCSLCSPREPVACDKVCRSTSVAPFGEPQHQS